MPNKNNQKDDCGENIFLTSSEQERYMHFLQAKSHTQKNVKGKRYNKNYRSGTSFEARFLVKLIKDDKAVKGGRFYASRGVTDIWWVDNQGRHNEAQLKFSGIKEPYISPAELDKLKLFATDMSGKILVWLVKKQSRKRITMERI